MALMRPECGRMPSASKIQRRSVISAGGALAASALGLIVALTLIMCADARADSGPCSTPGNASSVACAIELLKKGNNHFEKGDFELALSDYNSVIAIDATSFSAYHGKAKVLLRQGHFENALAVANQALWIAPNNAAIRKMRARIYAALGRIDEAVADNALAGRLFLYSNPGTFMTQMYNSEKCDSNIKYLFQIHISAGKVIVQPLNVGTDDYIALSRHANGMIFRIGRDGCSFDLKISKPVNEPDSVGDMQNDAEKIVLSLSAEAPSFSQVLYQGPTMACAYTNILVRTYWGVVEFTDNYSLPPGVKRPQSVT